MNKVLIGVLCGGVLGVFDGLSALLSDDPAVAPAIVGIVIGSTTKGILAGVAAGFFARKFNNLPLGIGFGLLVGAALATVIAVLQNNHYVAIILPGSAVGAIVGFATQKFGRTPVAA